MSAKHQGPKTATACGPCSPALRNRYFRGKLLTVADYQREQLYMNSRRRLITRGLLGWGVVSGFEVARKGAHAIEIGTGLAIDCHGRELLACERVEIDAPEDILWLTGGDCGLKAGSAPAPGTYLLSAHYSEARIDGVRVEDGCGDAVCEPNHICETVVYSLRCAHSPWCPPMVGGCDDLAPGQTQSAQPTGEPVRIAGSGDLGMAGLCRESRCGACAGGFNPCRAGELARHGRLHLDFDAGVPLAYVVTDTDDCDVIVVTDVVQLVRACELTRIEDIGWRNWHEHPEPGTSRRKFRAMFVTPPAPAPGPAAGPDNEDDDEDDGGATGQQATAAAPIYTPADTHFWVCFSAPVQIASLTRDVFTMTLIQAEEREAVGDMVRVPISDLWIAPTRDGDPPGTTRGFRPRVSYQFWQGEIAQGAASGFSRNTLVEVRIHGDLIIDWAGQPLDGNAVGRRLPSGDGWRGGTFLSSWRVSRKNSGLLPRDSNATNAV